LPVFPSSLLINSLSGLCEALMKLMAKALAGSYLFVLLVEVAE
jgi:hypothetical protein